MGFRIVQEITCQEDRWFVINRGCGVSFYFHIFSFFLLDLLQVHKFNIFLLQTSLLPSVSLSTLSYLWAARCVTSFVSLIFTILTHKSYLLLLLLSLIPICFRSCFFLPALFFVSILQVYFHRFIALIISRMQLLFSGPMQTSHEFLIQTDFLRRHLMKTVRYSTLLIRQ